MRVPGQTIAAQDLERPEFFDERLTEDTRYELSVLQLLNSARLSTVEQNGYGTYRLLKSRT